MSNGLIGVPPYPYFLPRQKVLSSYFQAPEYELPPGGDKLDQSFQWSLASMDSQESTIVLGQDTIFWGMNGSFTGAGVFVQIIHVHQGKQRLLFNKPRPLDSVMGNGQHPFLLKPTYPMQAQDSVMVQVKSIDRAATQTVEVLLMLNSIRPAGAV